MDISSKPIAIFDSGFGGITVLKQLLKILPNEAYIFIGDNANIPYGNKSKKEIINLTLKIVNFIIKQNVKIIVIACNTITASAYDILKAKYDIPIMGVISNAVINTINTTKNNNVSILATEFTVNSNEYIKKINECNDRIKITQISCKDLCTMIENDWYSYDNRLDILKKYIKNIDNDSDTLILACTHYPLILDDIKEILKTEKNNIKYIIDPAYNTALSVKKYLEENYILNNKNNDLSIKIYSTGNINKFKLITNTFIPQNIQNKYKIEYFNFN